LRVRLSLEHLQFGIDSGTPQVAVHAHRVAQSLSGIIRRSYISF
jgi:hypothetical protein